LTSRTCPHALGCDELRVGSTQSRPCNFLLVVAALVCAQAGIAHAQGNYRNRSIQLVVTVPPGGAADFVARLIGAKLADALGQPIVISNRAGAGGITAAAAVAKSEPDGYTLLLNTIATHGIGPHIYANPGYEVPARTVSDVISLAKARPGELSFSSSGSGGAPHLAGEMFKS
jgi:tripartite-type tricarboxylate transporter receptor subunit TctC